MAFKKSGNKAKTNDEIKYEVLDDFGVVSTSGKDNEWELRVRYVSWNGNDPKYDIRAWKQTENGETCRKGLTLTGEEAESLYDILKKIATGK